MANIIWTKVGEPGRLPGELNPADDRTDEPASGLPFERGDDEADVIEAPRSSGNNFPVVA